MSKNTLITILLILGVLLLIGICVWDFWVDTVAGT
jgi:hypothetical protein